MDIAKLVRLIFQLPGFIEGWKKARVTAVPLVRHLLDADEQLFGPIEAEQKPGEVDSSAIKEAARIVHTGGQTPAEKAMLERHTDNIG